NKVKIDFMQATHLIVKENIKEIYAERNNGIFMLLQNFNNFFTLNYDPFLYLFLMHFKTLNVPDSSQGLAFQTSLQFIDEDLNAEHNNIMQEIRKLRSTGEMQLHASTEFETTYKPLKHSKKTSFTRYVKDYSETNNCRWKDKEIEKAVDYILNEEKVREISININDGAQLNLFEGKKEFVFNMNSHTQNLFFLHGAFHIYKDKIFIKKITQESDKALYEKLETILNKDDQEVVCVFQSENKLDI